MHSKSTRWLAKHPTGLFQERYRARALIHVIIEIGFGVGLGQNSRIKFVGGSGKQFVWHWKNDSFSIYKI